MLMDPATRLGRAVSVVAGAAALLVVAGVMAVTFAAAVPDPAGLASLRWLLLVIWTLALPPVWGWRLGRRLARVQARNGGALREVIDGLWLEFSALGLGAAVAALAVVRSLVR
jgi:hypothetical protein